MIAARPLRRVYRRLHQHYGPQHWWPATSRFEIVIGAVLTQNTSWRNVERTLAVLRAELPLTAEAILQATPHRLAEWLRPSGYYNIKAQRLRAVCTFFLRHGGWQGLDPWPTDELRQRLLEVRGVGPETADSIVLYAFDRPVFVVDAYSRRLFARLQLAQGDEPYERLRAQVEAAVGDDHRDYNEYHALIVRHAKEICRPRPRCMDCCLRQICPAGTGAEHETAPGE